MNQNVFLISKVILLYLWNATRFEFGFFHGNRVYKQISKGQLIYYNWTFVKIKKINFNLKQIKF